MGHVESKTGSIGQMFCMLWRTHFQSDTPKTCSYICPGDT